MEERRSSNSVQTARWPSDPSAEASHSVAPKSFVIEDDGIRRPIREFDRAPARWLRFLGPGLVRRTEARHRSRAALVDVSGGEHESVGTRRLGRGGRVRSGWGRLRRGPGRGRRLPCDTLDVACGDWGRWGQFRGSLWGARWGPCVLHCFWGAARTEASGTRKATSEAATRLGRLTTRARSLSSVTQMQGTFQRPRGHFRRDWRGPGDAYVLRLSPAGEALVFSTLLGGSWHDDTLAVALAPSGAAVVGGITEGAVDFPTTPGRIQTRLRWYGWNGLSDALVTRTGARSNGRPTWVVRE